MRDQNSEEIVKVMQEEARSVTIELSKSKFMAGRQCLKRLHFQVHQPELAAQPDAAGEAIIEQGREVGLLARQMFPGGVEVRSEGGLDEAIRATRELIANPRSPGDLRRHVRAQWRARARRCAPSPQRRAMATDRS